MLNFYQWLQEAEGIPTSCSQFTNWNEPHFMGVGSDLGCHLKKKKKKKRKYDESLLGNPGTPFTLFLKGLNAGCGGYVGKCPPPIVAFNIKMDNSGAGGGTGKIVAINNKLDTTGCGGYVGKCPPPNRKGCSGTPGPCPDEITSKLAGGGAAPAAAPAGAAPVGKQATPAATKL